jgi:hypothetical protein
MNIESPQKPQRHRAGALSVFITSISAAIVVAGGCGIVIQAFILAAANYFALGMTFVYLATAANLALTLWLAAWTFARSVHVERRLSEGLEVDDPKLSILANLRGG